MSLYDAEFKPRHECVRRGCYEEQARESFSGMTLRDLFALHVPSGSVVDDGLCDYHRREVLYPTRYKWSQGGEWDARREPLAGASYELCIPWREFESMVEFQTHHAWPYWKRHDFQSHMSEMYFRETLEARR